MSDRCVAEGMLAGNRETDRDGTFYADEAPIRVLVVDDDPGFRALCRAWLSQIEGMRYRIVEAESASDAFQQFRVEDIDCALVGYGLPEMTGTELIKALQEEYGLNVPCIIMTAAGSEDIAMQAIHAGAVDYIPKHQANSASLDRAVSINVEKARLRKSVQERTRQLVSAMEELEQKNFEIRRFYHTVSHEIKTPLSSAREFASLVLDGVMGDVNDEQVQALHYVTEACDQIARHFDDLVEVARSDTGKMAINRSLVSVKSIIDRSVTGILPAVSRKQIILERFDVDGVPDINVDGFRLVQVVSNLLSNAVQHSSDYGRINVSAEQSDEQSIRIIVQDFGHGIDAEHLPRIFDRLFQGSADAQTTHGGLGLGLGLSIAREIVELHGGTIQVESDPGAGSTFFVTLPIDAPEQAETAREA